MNTTPHFSRKIFMLLALTLLVGTACKQKSPEVQVQPEVEIVDSEELEGLEEEAFDNDCKAILEACEEECLSYHPDTQARKDCPGLCELDFQDCVEFGTGSLDSEPTEPDLEY